MGLDWERARERDATRSDGPPLRGPSWRDQPATEKQLAALFATFARLHGGLPYRAPAGLTRGQASDLLDRWNGRLRRGGR
jgi:uncharacterized protein YbjT (DUF2867 family)